MLSKGKVKYIHSLEMKKYRNELNAFVAEGNKLVADMMFAFECELILAKPSWMAMQGNIPAKELLEAEGDDIRKASFLKNPQDVLAVFKRPDWPLDEADPSTSLVLALDGIQDPGNLGTIIRLADWFGIEHIVCSPDTADVFSPKTVQATMGALAHVKVHYTELEDYLKAQAARQIPLFGTFLDGENMYTKELSPRSPVRMRTASSMGMTKIRPSPISPVCAALMMACTVFSTFFSRTTMETRILSIELVSYTTPR